MPLVTIYGASDDLVEFEGAISDEFYTARGAWQGELVSPEQDRLTVTLTFGKREWEISVTASGEGYPSWPMHFTQRPDREGDPALVIDVPEGTVIVTDDDADD